MKTAYGLYFSATGLFIFLLLQAGCKGVVDTTKSITFVSRGPEMGSKEERYSLDVTGVYKSIKESGDVHFSMKVKSIVFPDSSIVYISDNFEEGSIINWDNKMQAGLLPLQKQTDTLHLGGLQTNGKYWKEIIMRQIVVGYRDVIPNKKNLYDDMLKSIRKD